MLCADAAERRGRAMLATTRPAYTGSAYASGFSAEGDGLLWHVNVVAAGLYQIEIRYSAPALKGFVLRVNDVGLDGRFPATGDAFATLSFGKVEFKAGDNVLELEKGWGYFDIDRIELIPTERPEMKKPPATLTDKDATPAAKALLKTLLDDYGHTTRSGVIGLGDAKRVQDVVGVTPAIMGGDLIDYSPTRVSRGASVLDHTERLIENYRDGYRLTVMWHWNAPAYLVDGPIVKDGKQVDMPWYRAFYTGGSTFNLTYALNDPAGNDYALLLHDIDAIAVQLKKYSDANIPILWRPLHEADGGWFWWGAEGPDAFKRLWCLMHDRLTKYHGFHNLIWVYTGTTDWAWYPPADQFDVIGVDAYPKDARDPGSATWDSLQARWGSRKLLALTEYGGVPDLAAMARLGIHWSYFVSWSGKNGPAAVPDERLKALYTAPTIANRPTTQPVKAQQHDP